MVSLKIANPRLLDAWHGLTGFKYVWPVFLMTGLALCIAVELFDIVDLYLQLILIYLGINIILTVSLNLINGYMGEFSVGHAGFMAIGAYVASLLTIHVLPSHGAAFFFPLAVLAGGMAAGGVGFLVAIPSFKTRGDYLAIVTLAFCMIVKSVLENIDAVGGPRGLLGMEKLTTLPGVFFWTALSLWVIRNLVYSNFGRGVLAIRED
jgi:branched-chain amino acid transport system permease protein